MSELSTTLHEIVNEIFRKIPSYVIQLGVFEASDVNKRDPNKNTPIEKVDVTLTNAKLMFIHEYGSPLQHIPDRPVLKYTVEWANESFISKAYDKALDIYFQNLDITEFEDAIKKFICEPIVKYARKLIYANDGRLKANSYRTIHGGYIWVKVKEPSKYKRISKTGRVLIHIKGKRDNHPLFVTGQLARSITYRLVRV